MCTILILNQILPSTPVLLAANRDEFLQRRSSGPQRLDRTLEPIPEVAIVGGRDEERGGTWMGATETGFFVIVTNQRGSITTDTSEETYRSRGELVLQALAINRTTKVCDLLRETPANTYRPFNLLFGDAKGLWVAYGRQHQPITLQEVPQGLHILPNGPLDQSPSWKVEHIKGALEALTSEQETLEETQKTEKWIESLQVLLGDHQQAPLESFAPEESDLPPQWRQVLSSLCIHSPTYGTRSASILALEEGRVARYLYADGAPCESPFADVTGLFPDKAARPFARD